MERPEFRAARLVVKSDMGNNFDTAAISLLLGWSLPFGWEAVKEQGWRRYVAIGLTVICLGLAALWVPLAQYLPSVANGISAAAVNPQSWLMLVVFCVALVFLTGTRPSLVQVPQTRYVSPFEGKTQAPFAPSISAPELRHELEPRISALETALGKIPGLDRQLREAAEGQKWVHESLQKELEVSQQTHLDLLHLLNWGLNRSIIEIVEDLLRSAPTADENNPPENSSNLEAKVEELNDFINRARKDLAQTHTGWEVANVIAGTAQQSEGLLLTNSPQLAPDIHPFKFRSYFIAARQAHAIVEYLKHRLRQSSEADRTSMITFLERYRAREKPAR